MDLIDHLLHKMNHLNHLMIQIVLGTGLYDRIFCNYLFF